jgi:hypothetical protein
MRRAGVAALIVSQHGKLGSDGDVKISPDKVKDILFGTTIDQGAPGRDECFGYGRVDALRAVTGNTSSSYDSSLTAGQNQPRASPERRSSQQTRRSSAGLLLHAEGSFS